MRVVTPESVDRLPPPVARSLRRSGVVDRPVPSSVSLAQRGEILLRDRWLPFTATESYTLDPASFRWDSTVKLAGVPIARATDSLQGGRGRMHVKALGLFTVVDETGPVMDQASVVRWLNETMWFPHVWAAEAFSWTPVDDTTARGAVTVGGVEAEADFIFDGDGRLVDFRAQRHRVEDGKSESLLWSTPITGHATFAGCELPSAGTAVWAPGTQDLEYIRLELVDLAYA